MIRDNPLRKSDDVIVLTEEWRLAERQGFEPWRRLPAYTRSRRAPSTTRPPLRLQQDRRHGTGHDPGSVRILVPKCVEFKMVPGAERLPGDLIQGQKQFSTSSAEGIAGAVPGRVTESEAAATA